MPTPRQLRHNYPIARMDDIVENYHGTPVADPYRWLEDAAAPETQAWVAAQQRLTQAFLDEIPRRELIKARLTELWNYSRLSVPINTTSVRLPGAKPSSSGP